MLSYNSIRNVNFFGAYYPSLGGIMSENEQFAVEILCDICETDEIREDYDMDLVEEGFIDSFAVLQVIIGIEDKTGVKLQATDVEKDDIKSINALIKFLEKIR